MVARRRIQLLSGMFGEGGNTFIHCAHYIRAPMIFFSGYLRIS